jgi:hypothetical protein
MNKKKKIGDNKKKRITKRKEPKTRAYGRTLT